MPRKISITKDTLEERKLIYETSSFKKNISR